MVFIKVPLDFTFIAFKMFYATFKDDYVQKL